MSFIKFAEQFRFININSGMTNRKDMIDEALMRPGRLEVQVEISLPNEEGRLQILEIHTSQMRVHKKISSDVDLKVSHLPN